MFSLNVSKYFCIYNFHFNKLESLLKLGKLIECFHIAEKQAVFV